MATPKLTANTLIRQVDLPTWEWVRQMPAVSSALSSGACAHNSNFHEMHGRYVYYIVASASFWRYDTWTDGWMQLSSPPVAVTICSDLEFMGEYGSDGRVLSAGSTTMEVPGFHGRAYEGYEVRITGGTGKGQRRTVMTQAEPVVADRGIVTGVGVTNPLSVFDATKNWIINQWAGYSLRIEFGTGVSQCRQILYNAATSITFANQNKWSENQDAWPAQPSPLLLATAGVQTVYSIESSILTLDSVWATTPDATSAYKILTGIIIATISGTLGPLIYSIGEERWYYRGQPTNAQNATTTESRLEACSDTDAVWWNGTATNGSTTTLTDSSANWTVDEFIGKWVWIPSGTGVIGFDRFDIASGACLNMAVNQQFETLTTGTMACYDGGDRMYFTKDATQRIYYLDLVAGILYAAPQFPYVAGTATVGNRFCIFSTRDRLKFLLLNRHANVEMFRALLFW